MAASSRLISVLSDAASGSAALLSRPAVSARLDVRLLRSATASGEGAVSRSIATGPSAQRQNLVDKAATSAGSKWYFTFVATLFVALGSLLKRKLAATVPAGTSMSAFFSGAESGGIYRLYRLYLLYRQTCRLALTPAEAVFPVPSVSPVLSDGRNYYPAQSRHFPGRTPSPNILPQRAPVFQVQWYSRYSLAQQRVLYRLHHCA